MLIEFNGFFWIVNIEKNDIKPWIYTLQSVLSIEAWSNNYELRLPETHDTSDNFKFIF